jgi:hypothetical protein
MAVAKTINNNTNTNNHACKHVQGFVVGSWQFGELPLQPHRLPLFRGSQLRAVKPRCRTLLSVDYLKSKYCEAYPVLGRCASCM